MQIVVWGQIWVLWDRDAHSESPKAFMAPRLGLLGLGGGDL